jgi:hypothetical protein
LQASLFEEETLVSERHPANDDKIQSQGRKDNAAQHVNTAPDNEGAERYPSVRQDDSVEQPASNPRPRQGAGDGGPAEDR